MDESKPIKAVGIKMPAEQRRPLAKGVELFPSRRHGGKPLGKTSLHHFGRQSAVRLVRHCPSKSRTHFLKLLRVPHDSWFWRRTGFTTCDVYAGAAGST